MVNVWKLEEHSGKGKYNTEYVYDIISFLQVLSMWSQVTKDLGQVQEEAVKDDNQTAGGLLLKSSLNLQEITLS